MTDSPYRPENEGPLAAPVGDRQPRLKFVAVQAPFATPEKLERARELVRTLAVAHTNAALYPITHPLVAQSLSELVAAVARARDIRLRGRHRQHLQGHAVRREPGLPRGERHLPQAHRGAARPGHLGGDVLLLDDRRGGRRAHRPARRRRASTDIDGARAFLEARGVRGITVAETTTLDGTRRRGAQPRGARAGARELRRRRRRDARHRDAGQARHASSRSGRSSAWSSRCSTTCSRTRPPCSA